ncbi:MAG TPA: type II toxin-antitoxin system Phd/YefM family antitoxin [Alphaproteobacteria bacterium]|nr:type II toxin-antitoxin system Phd/YefM family antitoxin [Alphaproteobacteria bacterium]
MTIDKKSDKALRRIPAGNFKAECLRLMDEVARRRAPIIITKRGKPVAKLVPVETAPAELFGSMAGTMTVHGDIVAPLDEAWEADGEVS